ncbi:hypothetical protein BZB76_0684 [Actinomadura pelletieri DSM 43383]|uniref:Uncharacterized protein n=1 Tax=Actinomadura pelletieri DSM 43383 TaxID=1120940 RepID=A0A495QZ70_9ACTN|nr:hypothetical protein [Actinomadura pelletieri]RKS79234.1 hypothetical protein BZB76_0684 [Actinomadura pelletieri DSM 43383]
MRLKTWSALLTGAALVTAVTVWHESWRVWPPLPEVDQRVSAAALPVIDRYLESGGAVVWPSSMPARMGPRWFCAEVPIETERRGSQVRVSLEVDCGDYARVGGGLVNHAGTRTHVLATLDHSGAVPVVRDVAEPDDGAFWRPSMKRLFSERALAEFDRRERQGRYVEEPDSEAARAFGLPPGTKARRYEM